MILYNGPNTPFGRMALATAIELGIELENRVINVFQAEFLDASNPLRQIPTLVLDDGQALYDSRVICNFLCERADNRSLIPAQDPWAVQTRWWLALGVMEASVLRTMELLRPKDERSPNEIGRYERRIDHGVAHLEAQAAHVCSDAARIDRLAVAIALEYIDFRVKRSWRATCPNLARWLEQQASRPSLASTRPRERRAE